MKSGNQHAGNRSTADRLGWLDWFVLAVLLAGCADQPASPVAEQSASLAPDSFDSGGVVDTESHDDAVVDASATPAETEPAADRREAVARLRRQGAAVKLDRDGDVLAVNFSGRPIEDSDLAPLEGMDRLQLLNLDGTLIGDAGLAYLQGLAQLRILRLNRTRVTDAGMMLVKQISSLEYLHLDNTSIGDAGLEHVQELRKLRSLRLTGTRTTTTAKEALVRALPDCSIHDFRIRNANRRSSPSTAPQ